jgi:hypothetical protein
MHIIHFTRGATDPLEAAGVRCAHFLPLADGEGDTHLGCLHLEPGAAVDAPSLTHAAALLVVHGRIQIAGNSPFTRIQVHAGMGCVFDKDEPYSLQSDVGAILTVVESDVLQANAPGISTPERIMGQTWPSDIALTANANTHSPRKSPDPPSR